MQEMIMLLLKTAQERMDERRKLPPKLQHEVECTVLGVIKMPEREPSIDVVLSNGVLREKDEIIVCGFNDAFKTRVTTLVTLSMTPAGISVCHLL